MLMNISQLFFNCQVIKLENVFNDILLKKIFNKPLKGLKT